MLIKNVLRPKPIIPHTYLPLVQKWYVGTHKALEPQSLTLCEEYIILLCVSKELCYFILTVMYS